jgi:hypothetical protein
MGVDNMEVKVRRVWDANLDKYKPVLDKFNAHYQGETTALIEFKGVNEIFDLVRALRQDIYIDHFIDNIIYIYDDYIE